MSIVTETAGVITAATALVGIGVGKVLLDVAFLKSEVKEIRTRLPSVEKEQLEMKLLLKQILRRLKMPS